MSPNEKNNHNTDTTNKQKSQSELNESIENSQQQLSIAGISGRLQYHYSNKVIYLVCLYFYFLCIS